jgi:RHS repeat-associated protein
MIMRPLKTASPLVGRSFKPLLHSRRDRRSVRRLLAFALLACSALLWPALAPAQMNVQHTENKPDQVLKGDFRVDLSTLGMGITIPLGSYPGRGGVNLPLSLTYSSKVWRTDFLRTWVSQRSNIPFNELMAKYAENSVSGWTSSLDTPLIEFTGLGKYYDGEGVGDCGADCHPTMQSGTDYFVKRIHVHLPDGSSHEMRTDDSPQTGTADFSGIYRSVDGSRLIYNTATSTLYLPDGSRYLFSSAQVTLRGRSGLPATSYVDRNGNTLAYNGTTRQWTDTLGRVITNPLPAEAPSVTPGSTQTTSFEVERAGSLTNMTYTFHWKRLGDALTTSQTLKYTGNVNCNLVSSPPAVSPALFISSGRDYVCAKEDASFTPELFNPVVLSKIDLPTDQSYAFTYNIYGEIERVTLPTGGYERYVYGAMTPLSYQSFAYSQANRGVTERWVSVDGNPNNETRQGLYAVTTTSGIYTVRQTAHDNTYTERVLHAPNIYGIGPPVTYGFDDPLAGMVKEERVYNASNQMLRRTLTGWSTVTPSGSSRPRDPHVTKTVNLILDTGGNALAATTTMAYDGDLNVISSSQYDFVSVPASTAATVAISSFPYSNPDTLVRTDETTYLVNDATITDAAIKQAYRDRNLVGLPSSTRVKNAANTVVARSEIKYDEAAYPLLASYGAVTGWTDPGATVVRGNVTTTRNWIDISQTWIETHVRYDGVGNVRYAWDARGNMSEVEYASTYHYAYPTLTKSPVPDPSNNRATNTSLISTSVYDLSTGRVTSTKDANGQVNGLSTTYEYNDAMGRLTKVNRPDGGWTEYWYDRNAYGDYVGSRTKINATQNTEGYQFFDGLGRSVRSFQFDGSQWITSDTQYDTMGRVWRVSNPYLSGGAGTTINPSGHWTTTAYDALGRVSTVTTPDSAVVMTAYSGAQVTVTDQAGKARRSVSDTLGRLTQVMEPNASGSLTATDSPVTDYVYDALGNLRKVSQDVAPNTQYPQGVQQRRYFMYDSLGRLIRAKNPEQGNFTADTDFPALTDATSGNNQWSMGYSYDANGNLSKRKDARNVTTTNLYDNINRLTQTNYSDGTPYTLRTYDKALTNGRGLFYADYESSTSGTINYVTDYDVMGRPTAGKVEFYLNGTGWMPAYTTSRVYDKMGHVTAQVYPSGHTVSYDQFDVAGRLKNFTGNLGDGVTRTYATGIGYDPGSRLQQEQFGTTTALHHKLHYNVRGQLYDVRLSTVSWATDEWNWNRGAVVNYYDANRTWGASGTDNNGNLRHSEASIPLAPNAAYTSGNVGPYAASVQSYAYDSLNRLTSVGEQKFLSTGGGLQSSFTQAYTYDRWGNRTINQTGTTQTLAPELRKDFGVDPATNRLSVPSGQTGAMTYDVGGNLTHDSYTGAGNRVYDAENRMTSATIGINSSSVYTYDASGKRVRRSTPNGTVWQVYGLDGELLAEYAASAAPSSPQKEYGYRNGELLVTAEGVGTFAAFVKTDATTGGGWKGNYGTEGYNLVGDGVSYPAYAQVSVTGQASYTWAASTADVRALQKAPQGSTDRIAATWYSATGYTIDLNLTDGKLHRVALYCLDWDGNNNRAQRLEVRDAATNALLDSREVSAFSGGKYVVWNLRGHVKIKVIYTGPAGLNAVVSGLFFDASPDMVQWLVSDHLGTPRIVADLSGSLAGIKRHDYLPFGEELIAGVGGRTQQQGYAGDNVRQQFTGYEHDDETGLDYAQARYFSASQGRFTSVDPIFMQAEMATDPQRFNLYAYVRNNPLAFVDPTGESIRLEGTAEERTALLKALQDAVGEEAAKYLYINPYEVKDGDGNVIRTDYYVGIYTGMDGGNAPSFEQLNEVASDFGALIRDEKTVAVGFSDRGNIIDDRGASAELGRIGTTLTSSPGLTGKFGGETGIRILRSTDGNYGILPGIAIEGGQDDRPTLSIILAHELAHAKQAFSLGRIAGAGDNGEPLAVNFENKVRKIQNKPARKF